MEQPRGRKNKKKKVERALILSDGTQTVHAVEFDTDSEDDEQETTSPENKNIESSITNFGLNEIKNGKECGKDCWGCLNYLQPQKGVRRTKYVQEIYDLIDANVNTKSYEELSVIISNAFQKTIHINEVLAGNTDFKIWYPMEVYIHLKYKIASGKQRILNDVNQLEMVQEEMANSILIKDINTGKSIGSHKEHMRDYLSIIKMKKELIVCANTVFKN